MATTRLHSGSTGWPERTRVAAVPRLGQIAGMLIGAIALGGCAAALAPIATVGLGSVVVTGRTPADIAVSAVTGLDCSLVRLGDGKSYCRRIDPPPPPPAYCTRSLAAVDCWGAPDPFGYYQRGLADGPIDLTAEQEWRRVAPWPGR